jgi:N-carbamoyl-L-amino-acid hydrolase
MYGGRYDGTLGVLAGLEVLRAIRRSRQTPRRTVSVVAWTNEEGARFQPLMAGSSVVSGALDLDVLLEAQDDVGDRFGDELERIGYQGQAPSRRRFDAYYELHIEQGPQLDRSAVDVGLVTGGWPAQYFTIRCRGRAAHPGSTPMRERRNALVGAAFVIAAAQEVALAHEPDGRSTSTRIQVSPNQPGTIPDSATVTVDMRHPAVAQLDAMTRTFESGLDACARRANVEVDIVHRHMFGGLEFDEELLEGIREVAHGLGITMCEMRSQAAHDAYQVSRFAPAAMIFCPCVDGVSHNVDEAVEPARVLPSVSVLLQAVLRRANRAA